MLVGILVDVVKIVEVRDNVAGVLQFVQTMDGQHAFLGIKELCPRGFLEFLPGAKALVLPNLVDDSFEPRSDSLRQGCMCRGRLLWRADNA